VGQLVRHGADILQHTATSGPPTLDICQLLDTLLSFYNLLQGSLKVKEKALEGLGLLFVAHPAALLQPAATAAMRQALQLSAPTALKLKVLSNLLELLKVRFLFVLACCSGMHTHICEITCQVDHQILRKRVLERVL